MVLLVTLVVLVVLSTLAYTLSSRVAAQRHRHKYIIDYSKARYGCDSAVKYALATLEELDPKLISRPNVPDFSDLFALSEVEYQELLAQIAGESGYDDSDSDRSFDDTSDIPDVLDANDISDINDTEDSNDIGDDSYYEEPDSVEIPGPYGLPWPLVTEPIEIEIGSATVRIEIEDENAKYPLCWAMLDDAEIKREAKAGFETFCEWMGISSGDISTLEGQLEEIKATTKPLKFEFKPITKIIRTPTTTSSAASRSRTSSSRTSSRTRITRKTISADAQLAEQTVLFARLFHSSMVDTDILARPSIVSESRDESALKYTGMWASMKVNINTAPRHVLEAAFIFGGDAERIAEAVIQRRRIKPFKDIEELRKALFGYSDSIKKCEKYITTSSRFFTIRVTAVSGGAKASSVIAITKSGNRVQRVAVMNI